MSASVLHARLRRPPSRSKPRTCIIPKSPKPQAPTTVLFVRHASHDLLDRVLAGRMPGVGLSAKGFEEAKRLGRQLAERNISRVYTSPRQRALETAGIIARTAGVPLQISFALDEIDLGAWTGLSFSDLASDRNWNFWNTLRSLARPPEGESMGELQERVTRYLAHLHTEHPGGRIVLVSHAEVIRAAVMFCQGLSLDEYAQVTIAPAEVVELRIGEDGAHLAEHCEAG